MNLERLPNEEKLSLCRKYYLGGFAFLPFLWLVNVVWFFREAFVKPAYTEQLQIKTYVKRSALGLLLWVTVLTTWITIFQHYRSEWGRSDPNGRIHFHARNKRDLKWTLFCHLLFQLATDCTSSAEVSCDHNGFTVQVDVKLFNPEDLMVKVIGDFVEVQGKHEEKKNGPGMTTRQFNRRYRIPKGVDTMALESAVSPDGILIVSAPMLPTESSRSLI
ncbi:hypothetical protein LDENG_00029900 [Lucifuga dentata]|nr:hypothetical protein LDENG_00029900 [Lucifuga dentata]